MVSLGTQPANRKSGFGHSSPTGARAQDLSRQRTAYRRRDVQKRVLRPERRLAGETASIAMRGEA